MQGPRALKRYMGKLRSLSGKRNGVVPGWMMDDLYLFKLDRDRKYRKIHRRPRDGYQES